MAMIQGLDFINCNLITHYISLITISEAITLKYMVTKTTSYIQSCPLNQVFYKSIAILIENSREKVASLLSYIQFAY